MYNFFSLDSLALTSIIPEVYAEEQRWTFGRRLPSKNIDKEDEEYVSDQNINEVISQSKQHQFFQPLFDHYREHLSNSRTPTVDEVSYERESHLPQPQEGISIHLSKSLFNNLISWTNAFNLGPTPGNDKKHAINYGLYFYSPLNNGYVHSHLSASQSSLRIGYSKNNVKFTTLHQMVKTPHGPQNSSQTTLDYVLDKQAFTAKVLQQGSNDQSSRIALELSYIRKITPSLLLGFTNQLATQIQNNQVMFAPGMVTLDFRYRPSDSLLREQHKELTYHGLSSGLQIFENDKMLKETQVLFSHNPTFSGKISNQTIDLAFTRLITSVCTVFTGFNLFPMPGPMGAKLFSQHYLGYRFDGAWSVSSVLTNFSKIQTSISWGLNSEMGRISTCLDIDFVQDKYKVGVGLESAF